MYLHLLAVLGEGAGNDSQRAYLTLCLNCLCCHRTEAVADEPGLQPSCPELAAWVLHAAEGPHVDLLGLGAAQPAQRF
jgi:hypothetical protein